MRDTSEEVRQLRKRTKDLQVENDDLKRELKSRNPSRIHTEPSDMNSERLNMELRHIRDELMRYV